MVLENERSGGWKNCRAAVARKDWKVMRNGVDVGTTRGGTRGFKCEGEKDGKSPWWNA